MNEVEQLEVLVELREDERDRLKKKLAERISELRASQRSLSSASERVAAARSCLERRGSRRGALFDGSVATVMDVIAVDRHLVDAREELTRRKREERGARERVRVAQEHIQRWTARLNAAQVAFEAAQKAAETVREEANRRVARTREEAEAELAARRWWRGAYERR